jgi:predicted dithiol-disulfide oxidoreductase (DUF899 family)
MRVSAIPARTIATAVVDLRAQTRDRQAIVFVSSCAPCVAGLLAQYDELWRQGLDIKVVARTAPQQIGEARREYGWRLPIYSDYEFPATARACEVVYRPSVLVLSKDGRVVYAQEAEDDQAKAITRVQQYLRRKSQER